MVRHTHFARNATYNFTNSLQDLASNVNQLGLGAHKEKDYKCDELDLQAFLKVKRKDT